MSAPKHTCPTCGEKRREDGTCPFCERVGKPPSEMRRHPEHWSYHTRYGSCAVCGGLLDPDGTCPFCERPESVSTVEGP